MNLRGALALCVVVAGAACAPAGPTDTTPTSVAPPRPSANEARPGPSANKLIRVLYKDDWFGAVDLVGVDGAGESAVVRLTHPKPERVHVDTIHLAAQPGASQRSERWELTEGPAERALSGRGFPADESIRSDLARFAEIVLRLGPWHTRPALPSPTFAASTDGLVMVFGTSPPDGTNGDWLYAMGAHGVPKRIDEGVRASYSPVVSPSNDLVAFRGCNLSPCDYGLYVVQVGGTPHRIPGIAKSTPAVFTLDGAGLFSVGDGERRVHERCLFRATVDGKKTDRVACVRDLYDVGFAQDPESKTGVLWGGVGRSGQQAMTYTWIELETGKVLGAETIEHATGGGILGRGGLLALPMTKGGIAFADLANQRLVVLPEEESWFFGFEAARFVGDDLVLLRKPEGVVGYEIVRLDARTLVDVLGRSATDAKGGSDTGFIPPSN